MHDAEDVVHPHSFLLYNYLIPRVDVMQLPILPLPTHWRKLVHWSYADEFSETHMKDVPVREKISGFVPYAGTGTGFSRRVFRTLEQMGGYKIFNEDTMTEDYSMSKRIRETGFTSIFVNLVLAGGDDKWYTPLCKRTTFIANWAYFPMDFHRAVRQKTRWIIGISLQEWELGGWTGSLRIKENLLKDRKVFVAAGTSLLGYVLLAYFIVFALGDNNVIGFKLLPIIDQGSKLQRLVMVDTFFMFFRMFQRVVFVGMVYGLPEGLMSVPRLVVGNVINGLAAFRALQAFARARQGKAAVRWDNTQHVEGVGELPSDDSEERRAVHRPDNPDVDGLIRAFDSRDIWEVIHAMEAIPRAVTSNQRTEIVRAFYEFVESREGKIRSMVARISGYLAWEEMAPPLLTLLHDKDWAVRANAAKALLKQPNFDRLIEAAFVDADIYVRDLLVKVIEQDSLKQDTLIRALDNNYMITTRTVLLRESLILRTRYEKFKQAY
jgi:adsorption protein B